MNTKKFYTVLTENKFYFYNSDNYYLKNCYETLLAMINEEIAKEAEKSAGRKPVVRNAVKKFLSKDCTRPMLTKGHKVEIDGTTYYGYLDGFKLCWSPIDFGFGIAEPENTIQFANVIKQTYRNKGTIAITDDLKKNLNIHLKTVSAYDYRRTPFIIDGPNGYTIQVNADYLKACIDFTDAKEMIVDLENNGNGPIILNGVEDRHALLLPIRK